MKYQRVVITHYGGPDVLRVVEDELPEPQIGEVRVKILAAGVAWGDIQKREGFGIGAKPPFTPGYDIVGTVDKLGEGVSIVEAGQVVAALPINGGYAEYICLPASDLVQVPSGLDPGKVVCLVLNYVGAYQMLHRAARVKPGECVLVHSAAGGVGTALLQLGKLAELEMYGTASRGKHELVAQLGGIPIDYKTEDFVERTIDLTGGGVNVVFDPIGGTHLWQSYRTLRKGGRLVAYGAHSILTDGKLKAVLGFFLVPILNLVPDQRVVMRYDVTRPKYSSLEWVRQDLAKLLILLSQEKIDPVIAEQLPLVEAARAHQLLEKGSVMGKIVLLPGLMKSE